VGIALSTRRWLWILALLVVTTLILAPGFLIDWRIYNACWRLVAGPRARALTNRSFEETSARRQRGEYLAQGILACFRCHSDRDWKSPGAPPYPGKMGSGHDYKSDVPGWLPRILLPTPKRVPACGPMTCWRAPFAKA
jgi:hypothetical protein